VPEHPLPHPLADYGWDETWQASFAALAHDDDRPGRVSTVRRVNCDVVTVDGGGRTTIQTAVPSPRLAEVQDGATLPAVGDWVVLSDDEDTPDPVVVAVLPRRTAISRLDPADITGEQVLAANLDVLLIVDPLDRDLSLRRIERAIVLALQTGAHPAVVLTKADLAGDDATAAALEATRARLRSLHVDVVAASTRTGTGIAEVAALAEGARTLALIGPSGAGKSSLVNALLDTEAMAVGAVREGDAKGRHTTVTRELLPLPGGGAIIDTPGLRAVGLWEADLGVDLAFPDVFSLASECRFADCTHDHEPGCAVQAAVDAGELDPGRVASYRDLVDELAGVDERRTLQERERGERGPKRQGERTGRRVARRGRR
jgi:ribosome biogenesis GTPase